MKHIALGVNIGNLSRGPRSREPMPARCNRINDCLAQDGVDLRVVAFYRHTGNLVLETATLQPEQAARILSKADGATWIAVSEEAMRAAIKQLSAMPPPDPEQGVRWTPGLALAVKKPKVANITSTLKVRLRSIGLSTVAAWKRDRTTDRGRLDSKMREGGWGRVSAAVAAQTNSQWTARSLTTLQGVLLRASEV
jgi:hypothetical protein